MSKYKAKRFLAMRQVALMTALILTALPGLTLARYSHYDGYHIPYYNHNGGHNSYKYIRSNSDHGRHHKYSNSGRHYNRHGRHSKRHDHYGSSRRLHRGHH